jgi:ketosteroid isomerase-like protein
MSVSTPDVVRRYFEADGDRDINAIVALFSDDATVIDEGQERRGVGEIRDWQTGPASQYEYTVTVTSEKLLGDNRFQVTGRLDGNFPGATANLNFDFTVAGDLISHLKIPP